MNCIDIIQYNLNDNYRQFGYSSTYALGSTTGKSSSGISQFKPDSVDASSVDSKSINSTDATINTITSTTMIVDTITVSQLSGFKLTGDVDFNNKNTKNLNVLGLTANLGSVTNMSLISSDNFILKGPSGSLSFLPNPSTVNHSIIMPPNNNIGALRNDGLGNLVWMNDLFMNSIGIGTISTGSSDLPIIEAKLHIKGGHSTTGGLLIESNVDGLNRLAIYPETSGSTAIKKLLSGSLNFYDSLGSKDLEIDSSGNIIIYNDVSLNGEIAVKDNLVLLNSGETGAGVTLGISGLEIERGSLTNYQIIYDETSTSTKIGVIGSLQKVTTRNDNLVNKSIPYWNNATNQLESSANLTFDTTLNYPIITNISNSGTITIPTGTDVLVGRATTDTLTNKSLNNTSVFHVDNTDNTKKIGFITSGASASTTLSLASVQTTSQTLSVPNLTTSDVITTNAFTQTLTNKTLTGTNNILTASLLKSATTEVSISGATAPTNGQVLTATSGTTATWQTLAGTSTIKIGTYTFPRTISYTNNSQITTTFSSAFTGTPESINLIGQLNNISFAVHSKTSSNFIWSSNAQLTPITIAETANVEAKTGNWSISSLGCMVMDHPSVLYKDNNNNIIFSRATDVNGLTWNNPITIATGLSYKLLRNLIIVNNNPTFIYKGSGSAIYYVRADDSYGTSWSLFDKIPIITPFYRSDYDVPFITDLLVVNNNPAILYSIPAAANALNTNGELYYIRSTTSLGYTKYSIGTISQSVNTITGTNTVFTSDMVGGTIFFSDGQSINITAFTNSTTLTVGGSSNTIPNQNYFIIYGSLSWANTPILVNPNYFVELGTSPSSTNDKGVSYLFMVNGSPAVVFINSIPKVRYSYPNEVNGNGVWTDIIVNSGEGGGGLNGGSPRCSALYINSSGFPVIITTDGNEPAYLYVGTAVDGSTWSTIGYVGTLGIYFVGASDMHSIIINNKPILINGSTSGDFTAAFSSYGTGNSSSDWNGGNIYYESGVPLNEHHISNCKLLQLYNGEIGVIYNFRNGANAIRFLKVYEPNSSTVYYTATKL